jgi:hypothetical protein
LQLGTHANGACATAAGVAVDRGDSGDLAGCEGGGGGEAEGGEEEGGEEHFELRIGGWLGVGGLDVGKMRADG